MLMLSHECRLRVYTYDAASMGQTTAGLATAAYPQVVSPQSGKICIARWTPTFIVLSYLLT